METQTILKIAYLIAGIITILITIAIVVGIFLAIKHLIRFTARTVYEEKAKAEEHHRQSTSREDEL